MLLGLLLLGAGATWLRSRRAGSASRASLAAGWVVLLLALVSPLCALSVALFSARATQHMLLLVVAAPLLAAGLHAMNDAALPARIRAWLARLPIALPSLVFTALLWAWHVPALYDATFHSDLAYWAMHVSLLACALPLWLQLLQPGSARLLPRLLLGFATFMQMGLLGALLTLSPALLYEAHVTSTLAWGMTPLADQQLGGLVMWIPGCSSLVVAMLWGLYQGLRDAESPDALNRPVSRKLATSSATPGEKHISA